MTLNEKIEILIQAFYIIEIEFRSYLYYNSDIIIQQLILLDNVREIQLYARLLETDFYKN